MYSIFTNIDQPIGAVIKPPGFELVKRTYKREIDKIVNHYRNAAIPVKAQHILCMLITTGSGPIRYELERFMEVVYTRAPYLAKHFKFTSPISYGRQFNGEFYGSGTPEIIIAEDHYFNVAEAILNWKAIRAVRVLDHQISDIGLALPNGYRHSTAKGLAVISINIPLLLLQYRCYELDQYARFNSSGSLLGVEHFVHRYVIPNMLYSHADIVIINRLKAVFKNIEPSKSLIKYPFPIIDYGSKLDNVLDDVIFKIENAKFSYPTYLSNIPSIRMENAFEASQMPEMAKTKQVWWALLTARSKLMELLLDIGGNNGIAYNRTHINRLKTDIARIGREHIYDSILPPEEAERMAAFIERVASI